MSSTEEEVVPHYIDVSKASVARVYDAFLNGKDNYEIDREVLRQVSQVAPEVRQLAWDNRQFLIRATRFLAAISRPMQSRTPGNGAVPSCTTPHRSRMKPS